LKISFDFLGMICGEFIFDWHDRSNLWNLYDSKLNFCWESNQRPHKKLISYI
jgi:hypothetical protein